ncbi:MAG: methyltransferase domain-containing protein, partial [Nocardioidaceae bacterium]
MNVLEQHEICESGHRILDPFTEEKLLLVGDVCRLEPGHRQLDLACGKGEMLCRWAQRFAIVGVGVDVSDVFVDAARARAAELGVVELVRFERGDAASFEAEAASYDVVSCIGATWIGGGLVGTLRLMTPFLRPGGLLLVGEPYWTEEPPDAACSGLEVGKDDFASLVGTLDRFESAGAELVEMVLADGDSWDRYVAAQWWNVAEWLHTNPADARADEMRR